MRIQDGPKLNLLCDDCEQLFSNWENQFSQNVFLPLHDRQNPKDIYQYGDWALKFAVSVSWRALLYQLSHGKPANLTEYQSNQADSALEIWRDFLLDKRPHPDQFEQHILPMDIIKSHSIKGMSPYINRYLIRTVDMDLPSSSKRAFVYTKLCRLMIFGIIHEPHPKHWRNTKLHVRKGSIGGTNYVVPGGLEEYINYRSDKAMETLASISANQSEKVRKSINENLDALANSEVFTAIDQDYHLFGRAAFNYSEGRSENGEEV
ncbi:hypothetical protein ACFLU3_00380 [Chloroflexota bacterium]